jgi:signal transduction histidine kinase
MAGELDVNQLELLGRVSRNGDRLRILVEDLLKLSQIESATDTIEAEPTDLRTVVNDARDAIDGLLDSRDLDVHLEVPAHEVELEVDPEELERMLVNLLSNAVKFTPDGGQVRLRLDADDHLATLVVEDTGIGIPEDEQGQLFTRFFRSRIATERAIQGTGLGLSIVQAIVELHGGTIEVESEVDRGTRVTIRLPRAVPAAIVA